MLTDYKPDGYTKKTGPAPCNQSELIEPLGGTCPTCGQKLPKKKVCPKCGSGNVSVFDADDDFCLTCKTRFNGT